MTYYGTSDAPSALNYSSTLDVASWSKSSSNTFVELNNRISNSTSSLNIPISVRRIYGNSLAGNNIHISEFIITGYTTTTQRPIVFRNQKAFFNTP